MGDSPLSYTIGQELAVGGMARLWKITLRDGTPAVLREMQAAKLLSLSLRGRFQAGTLARRRLSPHPNLVNSLERGSHFLKPYEILEYVDGPPLRTLMTQGAPLLKGCLSHVLLEMAQALAWVHQCGLMHLDVKPENFLMQRQGSTYTVKLTDFDLCRSRDSHGPRRQLGTPGFMAPEQFLHKLSYQASDVFAFGLIAYQLLTGKHPFSGSTPRETWKHQASPQVQPRPMRELQPNLNPKLDFVVAGCLRKNLDQRYANMNLVLQALKSALAPKP
ncbi:MAG: serine/threonine-protein kinase [Oligosphaeraceae bacterium]